MWNIKIKQDQSKYLDTEDSIVVTIGEGMWEESEMGKGSQVYFDEWK